MANESVSILNQTVSVTNIGPIEVGGQLYTLMPGIPCEVPLAFLERFDGSAVLAHKFKTGDLKILTPNDLPSALENAKTLTEILIATGVDAVSGGQVAAAVTP